MRTVSKLTTTPEPASTVGENANHEEDKKNKTADEDAEDSLAEDPEDGQEDVPDKHTEKKSKAGKSSKLVKPKKAKAKGEKTKRGPARPYRKLPQDVLELRIQKLKKRIERTTAQAEDGKNFLSKYVREQSFRDSEQSKADA